MTYKAIVQTAVLKTIRNSTDFAFFPCKGFYPTGTRAYATETPRTSTLSLVAKFIPAVITTAITTAVALAFMAGATAVYVVAYIVAAFLDLFKGCFSSSVKVDPQDKSNSSPTPTTTSRVIVNGAAAAGAGAGAGDSADADDIVLKESQSSQSTHNSHL